MFGRAAPLGDSLDEGRVQMSDGPGPDILETRHARGFSRPGPLSERLSHLHQRLMEKFVVIDRIACAIYDPKRDVLVVFIESTRSGVRLTDYEVRLPQGHRLNSLAETGDFRVLNDIQNIALPPNRSNLRNAMAAVHSSLAVPMFDGHGFIGFIFFESSQRAAFDRSTQRDLMIFSNLINMAISSELSTLRAIASATRLARDLSVIRDFETGMHLERMARYARLIARELAPRYGFTEDIVDQIYAFAPLHDIGKIGIPESILMKEDFLNEDEKVVMREHVTKGMQIIERIVEDFGPNDVVDPDVMREIVRCHHEMLDGSGYPFGLKGDRIPIIGRIAATADVFDAITSKRPYKAALTFEDASDELRAMVEEGKLDVDCVAALTSCRSEVEEILDRYQDREDSHSWLR